MPTQKPSPEALTIRIKMSKTAEMIAPEMPETYPSRLLCQVYNHLG